MTTPTELIDPTPNSLTLVNDSASTPDPAIQRQICKAYDAWLVKSPSTDTRSNYKRDLGQFLDHYGYKPDDVGKLAAVQPHHVAAWRDHLLNKMLTNSSVRRKMTVLRSLFSYLQIHQLVPSNPAHFGVVAAPPAPRDGKTVGLLPEDCRRLLDGPIASITRKLKNGETEKTVFPAGIRDRALFAVLAYTGCRVGELTRLKVGSYKTDRGHRILEILGKGGKERNVPLHPEAVERLEHWLDVAAIRDQPLGPLFRPANASRGQGKKGFAPRPITRRAVQKLIGVYVRRLKLDSNVTVHSLRVTALTTAREQGSDIIDLQDFAGHADPRTTLTYIRNRDRLSKSPAYAIKY